MTCNIPLTMTFIRSRAGWLALAGLVTLAPLAGLQACRVAGRGEKDPEIRGGSPESRGVIPSGGSSGSGGYADSRVSLINAPCGTDPGLESFLAAARSMALDNKLVKLPAGDWKVISGGQTKSLCKLMADSNVRLALFHLVPFACAECVDRLMRDVRALPAGTTGVLVVAVVSGGDPAVWVAQHSVNDASRPFVVHDDAETLFNLLRSRTSPDVAPKFLLHSSGYGAFANTAGPQMDHLAADFLKLAGAPSLPSSP